MDTNQTSIGKKMTAKPATQPAKGSPHQTLLRLGKEGNKFFSSPSGEPYVCLNFEQSSKAMKIKHKNFKGLLTKLFFEETDEAPTSDALNQTLNQFDAIATFTGGVHPVELRVGEHNGNFYYDLSRSGKNSVVEIGKNGWKLTSSSPVYFLATPNMKLQVIPSETEGKLERLLKHIRFKSKDDKLLYLVYIVSCFVFDIPHPILILWGEKGAAKSTSSRITRAIVNPAQRDMTSLPTGLHDLGLSLQNNYMPVYDNLSSITPKISDLLCTAATGGGFSTKFFTNDEETILSFKRCVVLNGINVVASKADLLDRCIMLELDRIDEEERKEERAIVQEFQRDMPIILGGIFDVLSKAMAIYPNVQLDSLPRMADFAKWGYAIAEAIKEGYGRAFLIAYKRNRNLASEEAVSAHPVASAIISLMKTTTLWEGPVADLLNVLENIAIRERIDTRTKEWPRAPHALSRRINEVMSNLKSCGIDVVIRHGGTHKIATIQMTPARSGQASRRKKKAA
ncbi:hypothetical protein [Brevibacillus reuszeri]|uniref:hypothetical protein n=1 Tax=Brevibacillus reuszeri TaxID=54915 RepID=UPI003D218156